MYTTFNETQISFNPIESLPKLLYSFLMIAFVLNRMQSTIFAQSISMQMGFVMCYVQGVTNEGIGEK
jgi:hypothetical protein